MQPFVPGHRRSSPWPSTGVGLNYQWQVSADGGTTFTNISDTATNASYTNATTTLADDGNQYQVIVGGVCPSQDLDAGRADRSRG